MNQIQHLKCQSCGSTDVTMDPPYYQCNYCKSRHKLPGNESEASEVIAWHKKKWRLLIGLIVLVGILAGLVAYNTLLLRSASSKSSVIEKREKISAKKPTASFKNIVFSSETFSSIRDVVLSDKGTYLVAGTSRNNHIRIAEISPEGRTLFSRNLSIGFYVSMAGLHGGEWAVSYYEMGGKGRTEYLNADHKIIYKIPEGFAKIIRYEDGFIGVRDGRIVRFDGKGKQVWERVIDNKKMIAHAGARFEHGKTVPFSRQFSVLNLRRVVRLRGGNFVAAGVYNRSRFALVVFSPDGEIIAYKKIDLGRIHPDALHATKDGGFVLMARRGIRWITFDQHGKLLHKRYVQKLSGKSLYGYDISEDDTGYIVTYSEGDAMVIARITYEGEVVIRHRYAKSGFRLHPQKIIPAVGGGFLLAVNTEIHEPWLVKVDSDGQLNANLIDPTLDRDEVGSIPVVPKAPPAHQAGDVLPTQKHVTKKSISSSPQYIVPTTPLLGDRIRDMVLSPDGIYLYAATGATGFKIFQIAADGSVQMLSNLLRTRSKLIVKRHRISIAGGKIPSHGTPEYYDSATHVAINRDQTRAYVSDTEHGFYVVDIRDKSHPKLLTTLKNVKSRAFALSDDERTLYFYDGVVHAWRVDQLERHNTTTLNELSKIPVMSATHDMIMLHGKYLVVPDKREILLYDTRQDKVVEQYAVDGHRWVGTITSDAHDCLYVAMDGKGIEQLRISEDGRITPVNTLDIDTYFSDMVVLPTRHTLCYAAKEGTMCLDTRHTLDPKPKAIYRNDAEDQATALARLPESTMLYIAYHTPSIGRVEVVP